MKSLKMQLRWVALTQHPLLTRQEVGWSWSHVASHILSLNFKNSLIFSREAETCFELELTG